MEGGNFEITHREEFFFHSTQSSPKKSLRSFGMREGPMSDPETHCFSAKSYAQSCPIQIGPDTVFLHAGSQKSIAQRGVLRITLELSLNQCSFPFLGPTQSAELICGIGDQEFKFLISILGNFVHIQV